MVDTGFLSRCQYLLHDRDSKFCPSFQETLKAVDVKTVMLPARRPNLNAHAERLVRSVKEECLSKLIVFGDLSLRRALFEFEPHYHEERPHLCKRRPDMSE
jgi:transposase InsO family protein